MPIEDLHRHRNVLQRGGRLVRARDDSGHLLDGYGATVANSAGKHNVIGAGSVITRDTDDFEVWAGNPAVLLKRLQDSISAE